MMFSLQGGWQGFLWKTPIYVAFNVCRLVVLGQRHPSSGLIFLALGHNKIKLVRWWDPLIYMIGVVSSAVPFLVLLDGVTTIYVEGGALIVTLALIVAFISHLWHTRPMLQPALRELLVQWLVLSLCVGSLTLLEQPGVYAVTMYVYFMTGRASKRLFGQPGTRRQTQGYTSTRIVPDIIITRAGDDSGVLTDGGETARGRPNLGPSTPTTKEAGQ